MTALREGFGLNMPATMIKLVGTKADIRNGNIIGSPVSREVFLVTLCFSGEEEG